MPPHPESDEEEEVTDLTNPNVATKYNTCGEVVNKVLKEVMEKCVPGADIFELCRLGDNRLTEETGKLYNKKVKGMTIDKGVAFPTCISVNGVCGNYSPLKSETSTLSAGDVVKVDLGAHIDGFPVCAAHTLVCGEAASGRKADLIMACFVAAQCAARKIQDGANGTEVTEVIAKAAAEFDCKPVNGVLTHVVEQGEIDGGKVVLNAKEEGATPDECIFEAGEVYHLNVVLSTGSGNTRDTELRTTVMKRDHAQTYVLKSAKARQFMAEVGKRFPWAAFSLGAFEDETGARVGQAEARRHDLFDEYPVVKEKEEDALVAQFKYTVLINPAGTKLAAGLPLEGVTASKEVSDEELKALMKSTLGAKKKKGKK